MVQTMPLAPPVLTDKQRLRRAAAILREHEWVQLSWGDGETAMCAGTALHMAGVEVSRATGATSPRITKLLERAGADLSSAYPICDWNNKYGQTKENIVATFERAGAL